MNARCQFINVKRMSKILLQPTDSLRNLLTWRSVSHKVLKLRPVRPKKQSHRDLLLQQWRQASSHNG